MSTTEKRSIDRRMIWAANRFWMETDNLKTKKWGGKSRHHWRTLLFFINLFNSFLHLTGQYERGFRNAKNIVLRELDLTFSNLPKAFESFTILHLSDLHFENMPGIEHNVIKLLNNREIDLCVLTGDYRIGLHGPLKKALESLKIMIDGINSHYGFISVLGNHDTCHMVTPMEKMGIRMLINESYTLEKNGDCIQFIGTDDIHYYYTDQALHALEMAKSEFSIALIHSPELYDKAAEMGINLYLCGHTHAGQICLPGGLPIFRHLNNGRDFYKGQWSFQGLHGITHCGVGTSGIPIRFNTQGEILLLKLHKRSNTPPGQAGNFK